jgi:hypothetical protein
MLRDAGRIIAVTALRLRGVRVTALVGRSGTGKTFRARLIAEKRGMEVIVDDGLIIRGATILTGHWAKKESSIVAAARQALFAEKSHALEAREALKGFSFRNVLIVGTSLKMARKIAANLWLPSPSEVIRIGDIATLGEIEAAMRHRGSRSSHASPVPVVRVRRGPARSLLAAVGNVFRRVGRSPRIETPSTDARGSVVFSESAVSQMALHCVKEFAPDIEVTGVSLSEEKGMFAIALRLRLAPQWSSAGRLHALREYILHGLERHTGILVREVELIVDEIRPS